MSCYKVKYSKAAEKFLKKNREIGLRFHKAFTELSQDKDRAFDYDIKKFASAYDNVFRLRIGKYRAVFRVVEEELQVQVFDIGARGDIYKNPNL